MSAGLRPAGRSTGTSAAMASGDSGRKRTAATKPTHMAAYAPSRLDCRMGWAMWHSTIPRSIVADQIAYRHEVDEQAISVRPILHSCRDFVSRLSPFRTLGILRLAHGDLGFAVPRQGSVLRLINPQIRPQPFPLNESLGRELVLRTKGQDGLAANFCDVDSH